MKALIIVDVQNDFLPGGALGVDGGDEIVPVIEAMVRDLSFETVIASQDWHPEQTRHFEKWPVHCVAGTEGAALHPVAEQADVLIRKGDHDADDGYSAFEGRTPDGSDLNEQLQRLEITDVTVVGLALDYCVKATALDAAMRGYNVTVPLDATRAVARETGYEAVNALRDAGVEVR